MIYVTGRTALVTGRAERMWNERTREGDLPSDTMDPMLRRLMGTTNAMVWAEEFCRTIQEHPEIRIDPGYMVGWFANAMCVVQDAAQRAVWAKIKELVKEYEFVSLALGGQ